MEVKEYSKTDCRFSFVVSVSEKDAKDVLVCKREFNINNFDEESLRSVELKECIDDIVTMIDMDLKSKSRAYIWATMNLDNNSKQVIHGSGPDSKSIDKDLNEPIPTEKETTFKFTFFDEEKEVISKIWSGNGYPKAVIWSKNYLTQEISTIIDLSNKKYKYEGLNLQTLDFYKTTAQKAAADKSDLTITIKNHLYSVCSSFSPKDYGCKKIIYKQDLPELGYETVSLKNGKYQHVSNRIEPIDFISNDGRGFDRVIHAAYTTNVNFKNKKYNLTYTPIEKWKIDVDLKERINLLKS